MRIARRNFSDGLPIRVPDQHPALGAGSTESGKRRSFSTDRHALEHYYSEFETCRKFGERKVLLDLEGHIDLGNEIGKSHRQGIMQDSVGKIVKLRPALAQLDNPVNNCACSAPNCFRDETR